MTTAFQITIIQMIVYACLVALCLLPFDFNAGQIAGLSFIVALFFDYLASMYRMLIKIHKLLSNNLEFDEDGDETETKTEEEQCCGGVGGEQCHCQKSK